MKFRIIVGFLMATLFVPWGSAMAQNQLGWAKDENMVPYYRGGVIGIALSHDQSVRFDSFSYNSLSFNQEQVISMYLDEGNQDMIYYINQDGVTQHVSYGSTSSLNLNQLRTPKRDSFNPYGVKNPIEAVVTGVLNVVFNRRFDLFRNNRKKK